MNIQLQLQLFGCLLAVLAVQLHSGAFSWALRQAQTTTLPPLGAYIYIYSCVCVCVLHGPQPAIINYIQLNLSLELMNCCNCPTIMNQNEWQRGFFTGHLQLAVFGPVFSPSSSKHLLAFGARPQPQTQVVIIIIIIICYLLPKC